MNEIERPSSSQDPPPAIVLMARYPRFGKVKTRLSEFLGKEDCLEFYKCLLADSLERYSHIQATRFLFLSDCTVTEADTLHRNYGIRDTYQTHLQQGEDLGARLKAALRQVYSSHDYVLFLGADSPTVPLDYVRSGFRSLLSKPVVIGPSRDGGYYLIGLSEPREKLFVNINWGSPSVLAETLAKVPKQDLHLLPDWDDVDEQSDLLRLASELKGPFEGFPNRVHAFLRRMQLL